MIMYIPGKTIAKCSFNEKLLILLCALDTLRYLNRCHWWVAIEKKEALVLNLLAKRKRI